MEKAHLVIAPLAPRDRGCRSLQANDFEPAFVSDDISLDPVFPRADWSLRFADRLAYRIASHPADLKCHVVRVRLYRRAGNADAVFGALLDLNIVMGEKGRALRERLLNENSVLLGKTRYRLLNDATKNGFSAATPIAGSPYSRLTRSLHGNLPVVEKSQGPGPTRRTPLEDARDLLNGGQIEAAVEALETATMACPEDDALNRELLEIYRRIPDAAAFARMRERLAAAFDSHTVGAIDDWRATEGYFAAGPGDP